MRLIKHNGTTEILMATIDFSGPGLYSPFRSKTIGYACPLQAATKLLFF